MLLPISDADLAAFKARKAAQWERVASAIPGLQMIQSGDRGTSFMIGWSNGDDFEGVIFGQLPHVHLIDSAQLTPSDFSQAGVGGTVPKAYTGSYGTNGFLLDFANSPDIGNDVSGVGNDVTVTGLASGDVSSQTVVY